MEPVIIGPMNRVVKQLQKMERDMTENMGGFVFFGLTLPEEGAHMWRVVLSAPWIDGHQHEALGAILREMDQYLEQKDRFDLSIQMVRTDNPGLEPIHEALEIRHGLVEIFDVDLFHETIRRAYIITSQRLSPAAVEGRD